MRCEDHYEAKNVVRLAGVNLMPSEDPARATPEHRVDRCRECDVELGAGYLCDDCDTVEGWP
jgi:hypothetical protein